MDNKHIIFHIDVNNAFLSWTAVDMLRKGAILDIRTIPSVIGGDEKSRHGIVLAKSPVAKKMGVISAETIYSAKRKCSNLKIYSGNYSLYQQESNKLYNYYLKFTPIVERFSIDECFLDMSGTKYLYDDLIKLAHTMKNEIHKNYGITVNVGIGNNKLCAKMASDFEKPDKVHSLFIEEIETKMWPLPVGDLLFIGKKSAEKLVAIGIKTIGDLANADYSLLQKYFKNRTMEMINAANGIDDSPVVSERPERKSISTTYTMPFDTVDKSYIKSILLEQSDEIGRLVREKNVFATSMAIIIRTDTFINYSHQKHLDNPVNVSNDIYKTAVDLFESTWKEEPIRLIGIRLGDFTNNNIKQMSLFDVDNDFSDNEEFQKAVDKIKSKYGKDIIIPASLKK